MIFYLIIFNIYKEFFMKKAAFLICGIFFLTMALSAQTPTPLVIDYQFNVTAPDTANYLTFSGPQRFGRPDESKIEVTKDSFDTVSGASRFKTTSTILSAYQNDVFPSSVRGLLLFPVATDSLRIADIVTVTRANNGVITVQYVHRGAAYRITTDAQGRLSFPKANIQVRQVGFITAAGPQVIARDFSRTGEAAQIDWAKVWDTKIQPGRPIEGLARANGTAPANATTGAITNDWETSTNFHFSGNLQFAWDGKILRITGSLTPQQGAPK
jgi:hypothetical protein